MCGAYSYYQLISLGIHISNGKQKTWTRNGDSENGIRRKIASAMMHIKSLVERNPHSFSGRSKSTVKTWTDEVT
jgi:hypothetical protein